MRKVVLNMCENMKYDVIKKLVESNGNKNNAAIKLNCTKKHINRLIILYNSQGKVGFIHGNRNRKPSTAFSDETKLKVISLFKNVFPNCNITHFCEILAQDYNIFVSDSTVHKWLKAKSLVSSKARKNAKKKVKKKLHMALNTASSKKENNNIIQLIETIDINDAHPRRPRSKYKGEMIQMDASSFAFINDNIWHIHLAVDDASGEVVGAYFDEQETLNGYYNIFSQILSNYGIPAMFYTDRRTIFEYKKKNTLLDEDDTFTQFAYAAHQLGVEIKTTSIAQAKGRVERMNQTFQSRLPIELKRANITCIEQANEFLKSYIKKYNKQFALQLNDTKSVFEKQPSKKVIDQTLAIISSRTIDNGHSIKYNNNYYIPIDNRNRKQYFRCKTKCLVIESFTKKLYISIDEQIYALEEIPTHEYLSKEFDEILTKKKSTKKVFIPPMSHPWKRESFIRFQNKQKHREKLGVNV